MIVRILGGSILVILFAAIGISAMVYSLDYGSESHRTTLKCLFRPSLPACHELTDLDRQKLAVMAETEALQAQAAELADNIETLEQRELDLADSVQALAAETETMVAAIAELKTEKEAVQVLVDELKVAEAELVKSNETLTAENAKFVAVIEEMKLQQEREQIAIEKLELKAESYEYVFANLEDKTANLKQEVSVHEAHIVFLENQVTSLDTMIGFRQRDSAILKETLVVLRTEVADLTAKKDFVANYERFASLQAVMDKDLGNMSVFKYHDIPGTTRRVTIGTEYTDILSARPKHVRYWCYINLREKSGGIYENLSIRDSDGFVTRPNYISAGLDAKDISFAKSKCEPYNLTAS